MDSSEGHFDVAETYKGWTVFVAPAQGIAADDAYFRVKIQAAGGAPIEIPTDGVYRHTPSQPRTRAIAHARSFIDALGVRGDPSLTINFPMRSRYRHAVGVYFPVVVNGTEFRALVTRECLEDHFGVPPDGAWKKLFELHRVQVQLITEKLIRAGQRSNLLLDRSAWPS